MSKTANPLTRVCGFLYLQRGGDKMEALWFIIGFTVTTATILTVEKIVNG